MILSGNELSALAAKAARGAGAPPLQAEMFGRVAVHHLYRGRAPQHLRAALDALPEGPILTLPLAFTRIMERPEAHGPVPSGIADDLILSYLEAQPFAAAIVEAGTTITLSLETPAPRLPPVRIALPGGLARAMQTFAARRLVPDSDASRAGGAGAGLNDND